jgi:hypothetical protein
VPCVGNNQVTLSSSHRINSDGFSMGIPWNGCRASKSASRLTMTSALPSMARFKNISSLESRQAANEEFTSIVSQRLAISSSTANDSCLVKAKLNFDLDSTSSNSDKVGRETKGLHISRALTNALLEGPSFLSSALTTTPVSITTRFNQESSSISASISFSESPLAATRLSMVSNISPTDLGLAWARQAVNKAAFTFFSFGIASKTKAILSGKSSVIVFIFQIYVNRFKWQSLLCNLSNGLSVPDALAIHLILICNPINFKAT